MPHFELQGATAVVTGASRGLGPHIAAALAARGAKVALLARSTDDLAAVAGELSRDGAHVLAVPVDLTSAEQRRAAIDAVERGLGAVGVLVNNAGGDPQRRFHDLTESELDDVLELNLVSAVMLSRLVLPGMLARGRGHIVNVSSMAGRVSFPLTEAYAAAKDGLIAFGRVLRADYRGTGVSASTLILGPVRDAGAGARTAEEMQIKLPPRALMTSPQAVARATVRAIERDRPELALVPGPGRAMRAVMDRFPGIGPAMNRATGAERTMSAVAEERERQAARSRSVPPVTTS